MRPDVEKGIGVGETYLEWEGVQSLVVYGNFPEVDLVQEIPEEILVNIDDGR